MSGRKKTEDQNNVFSFESFELFKKKIIIKVYLPGSFETKFYCLLLKTTECDLQMVYFWDGSKVC